MSTKMQAKTITKTSTTITSLKTREKTTNPAASH